MSEVSLNRADKRIDEKDFSILLQLHMKNSWLTQKQSEIFELWCLAENNDQKEIIKFLIENFSFIGELKLAEESQNIAEHIENKWALSAEDTFLLATCDDREPDGSQLLIQSLKNKFSIKWKQSNFFNSLPIGVNEIPEGSNIILVDDFIGTGKTISRKLKYVNDALAKRGFSRVTIKVVSMASMHFAKEFLDDLDVEYFSAIWLKKGISELVPEGKMDVAIKSMEELEMKLQKKFNNRKLQNFGYNRSESLFSLGFNNIPNNVFPIFWWPYLKGGVSRKTIFKRV